MGITPKVNEIAWQVFELAYYKAASSTLATMSRGPPPSGLYQYKWVKICKKNWKTKNNFSTLLVGLKICWLHTWHRNKSSPLKKGRGGPGYDTKLYLMVRFQFWRSGIVVVLMFLFMGQIHLFKTICIR